MQKRKTRAQFKAIYPDASDEVVELLVMSERMMDYQDIDRKVEQWLIDKQSQTAKCFPSKEDSFERLLECDHLFFAEGKSVEDIIEHADELERLRRCKVRLKDAERYFVEEKFEKCKTDDQIAETLGVSRQAVSRRLERILVKLRNMME